MKRGLRRSAVPGPLRIPTDTVPLSGIARGGTLPDDSFCRQPRCNLVVVKLKQAKRCLRDYYLIRRERHHISGKHRNIMMGIRYLRVMAHRYRMPWSSPHRPGFPALGSHKGPLAIAPQSRT